MSKKRKRLIIIGIVFIFVCLCVDLLGGFRWRMVLKTKITYDSVLTKYIERSEEHTSELQ